MEKAAELKSRFEVSSPNSLFLSDSEQKNVPLDGLHVFIDKSWESIKAQKELNLPDQREMVASYRCNELKDEALQQVEQQIKDLTVSSHEKFISNFKEQADGIMKSALDFYTNVAKQYDKKVFTHVQKELCA